MASTHYRDYQPVLAATPLSDPYGQAWNAALGAIKDQVADQLKQAVKCRMPLLCPPDALQLLGQERSIQRGIDESQAGYAQRIVNAWTAWASGGTALGVLNQLFATGYPSSVVMQRGLQYTLDAGGNLVVTSTGTPRSWEPGVPNLNNPLWSAFSVIVPHPWPARWLSAGNWPAPIVVGAGTGTIGSVSGVPSPDSQYTVKITLAGAPGTGKYAVSTDSGVTYGSAVTIAASGNALGGGPTFTASGSFTLGDRYYLSQVPPGDSSPDADLFRKIIAQWKPGFATCASIVVLKTGWLWGYPIVPWGGSHPPWGGCSVTNWTPPL